MSQTQRDLKHMAAARCNFTGALW